MSIKVSIAGASGYTGVELLRILLNYEEIEIIDISSRQYEGKALKEVFPFFIGTKFENLKFSKELDKNSSDFYFLCLPHEPSLELAKKLIDNGKKVIDLSASYRIKDITQYPKYYKFNHKYPNLLEKAVYGLPEIYREEIKNAWLIANPGCYPTATLLALYPSLKHKIIKNTIIVNALSGISGAGRSLKQQFHYPEAFGNAYAYSPLNHRHIPEMEDQIKIITGQNIKVRFTPHILPVSRGMIATVSFETSLKEDELISLYIKEYEKETFIRLVNTPPQIKNVVGTNYCDIFVRKDERTNTAVIISAIDNLGKGASSQAIQNFNLMANFKEEHKLKNLQTIYP
jgi:N-acetyl-gamma-glutamyl-phosphate reductase